MDMQKKQLERIRKAYDLTVWQYREGIGPLAGIPEEFKNSAEFKAFMRGAGPAITGSGAPGIKKFLAPQAGMKFLDIGCCANLANYRFDRWPSLYYGVDISPELIGAMKNFAKQKGICIGALEVAEAAALPFPGNYFDIAMAIGVFEYVDLNYIKSALAEMSRVLKADAKMVVDIPNMEHPHVQTMFKLEEYLGRPNIPKSRSKFEKILTRFFNICRIDKKHVMLKYFTQNSGSAFSKDLGTDCKKAK
jgi:SAM-dependent methyltransferase